MALVHSPRFSFPGQIWHSVQTLVCGGLIQHVALDLACRAGSSTSPRSGTWPQTWQTTLVTMNRLDSAYQLEPSKWPPHMVCRLGLCKLRWPAGPTWHAGPAAGLRAGSPSYLLLLSFYKKYFSPIQPASQK